MKKTDLKSKVSLTTKRGILLAEILMLILFAWNAGAQGAKPNMKLGAYYYGGWGGKSSYDDGTPEHDWAKGMPKMVTKRMVTEFAGREPVWGWREDTQEIMERQIDLAADNGIAYFSFCWYWQDNKGPIKVPAIEKDSKHLPMYMFMDAKNNNRMEFCLLVANHRGFEIVGTEAWKQAADYWIENYFMHPRYLRVDGKPLLIIYIPGEADKNGLDYLQEASRKAGLPGVAVVACRCCEGPEDGFQLQTRYNIKPAGTWSNEHPVSEKHSYKELMEANIKGWSGSPDQPLIPVVTQGWDSRPWEGESPEGFGGRQVSWFFERAKPKEFKNLLKELKKWMDAHPTQITKDRLAIIYAWNEIGEGGWLVPCKDDPTGKYLKAIGRVVYGK
jgi:hypothetical protein